MQTFLMICSVVVIATLMALSATGLNKSRTACSIDGRATFLRGGLSWNKVSWKKKVNVSRPTKFNENMWRKAVLTPAFTVM